eukprot:m.11869 g.11869  ORF g.11869 m.11869 type:complete len:244 (-) comp9879_c0_seq1:82-813(-)
MASVKNLLVKFDDQLSCLSSSSSLSVEYIQQHVLDTYHYQADPADILHAGRRVESVERLPNDALVIIKLPLLGGKGGFGSLLRALGNKRSHKETDNIDACRGLDGRRLRHVNDEKKLNGWLAKEEERRAEKEERKAAKLDRMTAVPKHAFDHHGFQLEMEDAKDSIGDAVKQAMAAPAAKSVEAAKPKPAKISGAFQDEWDDEDLSDSSDDDNGDNDEDDDNDDTAQDNGETKSKRRKPLKKA